MDSITEFIKFIYDGVMSNITLVICILASILLIRIISSNFILLLLLGCLLSVVYKDQLNQQLSQRLRQFRMPVMMPTQEQEGFNGYGRRRYFNPTNWYNVANPTAGPVYWPLRYTPGYSGKDLPRCNENTLFTAHPRRLVCSKDRTKHIRFHHTGAPLYTSNTPPTDVPSCQQIPCPEGAKDIWTLNDGCPHSKTKVVCWQCVDKF